MKRLFSGKEAELLWSKINGAKNVDDLRRALYDFGVKMQELEERLEKKRKSKKDSSN